MLERRQVAVVGVVDDLGAEPWRQVGVGAEEPLPAEAEHGERAQGAADVHVGPPVDGVDDAEQVGDVGGGAVHADDVVVAVEDGGDQLDGEEVADALVGGQHHGEVDGVEHGAHVPLELRRAGPVPVPLVEGVELETTPAAVATWARPIASSAVRGSTPIARTGTCPASSSTPMLEDAAGVGLVERVPLAAAAARQVDADPRVALACQVVTQPVLVECPVGAGTG